MRKTALLLCGLALGVFAGCASSTPSGAGQIVSSSDVPQVAPALAVERFLRAANANDLRTMAQLFGTAEGPIVERDAPEDVERRMFSLASVLRHRDFQLRGERIVPGRLGGAVELIVNLQQEDRSVTVPFVVVRARQGQWLVEQFPMESLLRAR